MEHSHKPGVLHQKNKSHASRHASKRANKNKMGGRIDNGTGRSGVKGGIGVTKEQRKHAMKIAKQNKRAETQRRKRMAQHGPPRTVGFVALVADADLDAAASTFLQNTSALSQPMAPGTPVHATITGGGRPQTVTLAVAPREIHAVLDLCKVADVLVLVHCAGEDLGEWDEQMLSSMRAQGTPTVVGLMQNVNACIPAKLRNGVRKDFVKFVRKNFPEKDEPKGTCPHQGVSISFATLCLWVCFGRDRQKSIVQLNLP